MHIHILGICGTFMAGLALLAREAGQRVTGSDASPYPPMSDLLRDAGVTVLEGYRPEHLSPAPDCVVVGNVMSRGNPAVEHALDAGLPYTSGPQWLAEHVLRGRRVLAVAGTHGKTTTSAMLAWVLQRAGRDPGFLIGGVPLGLGGPARLGRGECFVVEADEYDTAFFDKRSKFVHYRPRILVLNNLEYDHADIFPDLDAIQRQFHHLLRTVPGGGSVISNGTDPNLEAVLVMGCWTPVQRFGTGDWLADPAGRDGRAFAVLHRGRAVARVQWGLAGRHNMANGLAALAAAVAAGVPAAEGAAALSAFPGVKRRMELRGEAGGVAVYDDFAHHPSAISATLEGARAPAGRLIAVLEPRSNTMRMGVFRSALAPALAAADAVILYRPPDLGWDLGEVAAECGASLHDRIDGAVDAVCREARAGDRVVVMSNGAFGGIHRRILDALAQRPALRAGRAS